VVGPSWENRRLCDDGGCTGLIGSDGVCRECGKAVPFWGDERRRGMQESPEAAELEALDEEPAAAVGRAAATSADDDDDRALCPDGSCTGVLDSDGRCKVCGKVDPNAVIAMRTKSTGDDDRKEASPAEDAADDSGDRALCPDGACTGLIGDDGKCKVCGRSAEA
jgi:hypothetical protein